MSLPLMKCGHTAQGTEHETGKPACIICLGIHPGAMEIATELPDLTGRKAKCEYRTCKSIQDSSFSLAFFEHRPDKETDEYYCGCKGWD